MSSVNRCRLQDSSKHSKIQKMRKKHWRELNIRCLMLRNCSFSYLLMFRVIILNHNRLLPTGKANTVIEVIRRLAEVVVYGENNINHHLLFEYFCEKNVMNIFYDICTLSYCSSKVKQQILQTVSIILKNLKYKTNVYFFLSNNLMNKFITCKYNFKDEETVALFVTLLRTLSSFVSSDTIHFYYVLKGNQIISFALYDRGLELITHSE